MPRQEAALRILIAEETSAATGVSFMVDAIGAQVSIFRL
jgi:hypothetical protein